MSRRGLLWCAMVFTLTLLAELPAAWVARAVGLPARDVSGSLWHGQAQQLGPVGPLRWALRPWRMQADAQLGFQGQAWRLRAEGWPWRWRLEAAALAAQATVLTAWPDSGKGSCACRGRGASVAVAKGG